MNYSALDASTEACSVALQVNDKTFSRYELCPQSHSLHLLPMIDAVLNEAGIKLAELDGLVFGQGPGSLIPASLSTASIIGSRCKLCDCGQSSYRENVLPLT